MKEDLKGHILNHTVRLTKNNLRYNQCMKKKYTFEPIANNNQPGCEFGYRFEATEYNPSYDYCTHFLNLRKVQIILENKFPSIKFSKPLPHHFRFDAAADEAYFQLWYPNNWVEVNTSL